MDLGTMDFITAQYNTAVERGFITQEQADGAIAATETFLETSDYEAFEARMAELLGEAEEDGFGDEMDDFEALNAELLAAADADRGFSLD